MIKRLSLTAIAAAALLVAFAGPAAAQSFKGTVVNHNANTHRFVVADKAGHMRAIHARKPVRTGRVVKIQARKLRNGTFALRKAKVVGRTRHARVHGTVTWVNRRSGAFAVSARGASILVRRHKAGRARAAADTTPSVGDVVTVDATLDDSGDLEEDDITQEGDDSAEMDVHGIVLAVDQGKRTLSLSADDDEDSKAALTINVPAEFDLSKFAVNQEVELVVTPNADGTYTLVASEGDDSSETEADDSSDDQGLDSSDDTKDGSKSKDDSSDD
jgi:hypothetical protein